DESSATIARAVLDAGRLGVNFLFGADGAESLAQTTPEALEQVARSVNARTNGGQGLPSFLERGAARGISACILFVPARTGTWLRTVLQCVRRFSGPFHVIVGVGEQNMADEVRGWRRWLLQRESQISNLSDLREIVAQFQQTGARVHVFNPATGKA